MTPLPATVRTANARRLTGLAVGSVLLAGLTTVLSQPGNRGSLSLASVSLLYLVAVVAVAVLGGVWPAIAAAVASDLLLNFYFVPPFHTLAVEHRDNVIALLVYILVAVTVSVLVDLAATQRAAAARSGVEAQLLSRIAAEPVVEQTLERLLEHIRGTFGARTVALAETEPAGSPERIVAQVGAGSIGPATLAVPAGEGLRLIADGPALFGEDRQLLSRLAAAAARTLEAQRLAARAARAEQLAEVDRLRTAILAAVGHDLRTPLASIKAAASSLRAPDVSFTAEDRDELLATVEESTDRLDELVENLLAMSRLQAGVLSAQPRPVALDEVVARALLHAPPHTALEVTVADDLPHVFADPGLLERVVANLVANAARAVAGTTNPVVTLDARVADDRSRLTVIDHGPGVEQVDHERIFAPFQRLDDATVDGGLGLGLAIARGFTEAMGGTLTPTATEGGGLTMTVELPTARDGQP